jgi:GxxExxY protein
MGVGFRQEKQEGYDFMGAAFAVYNGLGHGFTEEVYQAALEEELRSRMIPFESQVTVPILYKGKPLSKVLRPDMIVFQHIIVELKAAEKIVPEHEAQLFNYLKATGYKVGYLLNFGCSSKLEWKRFVL